MVSICIATRNRCDELRVALRSALAQDYPDLEILVIDDASDDGTAEMLRREFPAVRSLRMEQPSGVSTAKNRGFREARGDYVAGLDDDAYYSDPGTILQLVRDFEDTQVAAVAMPFIEASLSRRSRFAPSARLMPHERVRSFTGCAYAIRRSVAIELGGYRESIFYRGEERDLSIRLIAAGHAIVFGTTPPVVHAYSPKRQQELMMQFGIRHNLLFDARYVPHPYFLPRLAADAVNLLLYRTTIRAFPSRLLQILQGLAACARRGGERQPVSRATYRVYRSLPLHGADPWSGPAPRPAEKGA